MINVGEKIPSMTLSFMGEKGPETISTDDIFAGKKVILFAVPGAFTPGCSNTHVPGFVVNADKILAAGVDQIVCTSVNDAFVMGAWGKSQNADQMLMLADGSAFLAKALGLDIDLTERQFGVRSKRYAMIVNDGVVELLNIDEQGVDKSSAETILAALQG